MAVSEFFGVCRHEYGLVQVHKTILRCTAGGHGNSARQRDGMAYGKALPSLQVYKALMRDPGGGDYV